MIYLLRIVTQWYLDSVDCVLKLLHNFQIEHFEVFTLLSSVFTFSYFTFLNQFRYSDLMACARGCVIYDWRGVYTHQQ